PLSFLSGPDRLWKGALADKESGEDSPKTRCEIRRPAMGIPRRARDWIRNVAPGIDAEHWKRMRDGRRKQERCWIKWPVKLMFGRRRARSLAVLDVEISASWFRQDVIAKHHPEASARTDGWWLHLKITRHRSQLAESHGKTAVLSRVCSLKPTCLSHKVEPIYLFQNSSLQ